MSVLVTVLVFATFVYSVIAHEVAHGWVALRCGDATARNAGRLTANPIPHVDPWMSIALPLMLFLASGGKMLFGAAKPVPVFEARLRRWPLDPILVALAGIATNLLIAIACALALNVLVRFQLGVAGAVAVEVLLRTGLTNVGLAVFNLIPIPPLDGSRVFRFLLSGDLRTQYLSVERYGFVILMVLMNLPDVRYGLSWVIVSLASLLGLFPPGLLEGL